MLTAAVLIAGLLAALFLLPPSWLKGLLALLVAAAGYEWARLCGMQPALYALSLGVLLFFLPADPAWFVLAAAFWLLVAPLWLWRGMSAGHRRILALAGVVVLVPAALAMLALPPRQVLAVLVLTWLADTAAYFIGVRYGRHKLAPAISPGKSWEGAAAGVAAALLYAAGMALFAGMPWLALAGAAIVLVALSVVGDLFESAAKRQAGVKDSGAVLPGHGGILDRIDSATATLPLAAAVAPWIVGQ